MTARALSHPRLLLAALVGLSAAVRAAAAMQRPTPLYYPDEYLYTALARSIAATGLPRVRGAFPHFPSLLGPYLMSPAWLIHDVDTAYRVALAWGSLWSSLAAFPAYSLARRVGVSSRGALLVALFALLVPDAAYTTALLSEPYAYPVFLAAAVVAVDTIAAPTARRQASLLGLMLALSLLRFQFVVFPAAYALALLACSGWSPRAAVRRQRVVATGLALAIAAAFEVGFHRFAGYYTHGPSLFRFHPSVASWFVLDLFVLLIAAGWVVVPGACVGFTRLLRGEGRQRAFAALALALIAALLAVAAPFGPAEGRVYERYFFYGAPLIGVAFVWYVEQRASTKAYAAIAYVAGAAGLLLPLASGIHGARDDMSPTLLGLGTIGGGGDASALIWATGLAILAVLARMRIGGRAGTLVLAFAVVAAIGAMGARSLLGFGTTLDRRLDVSPTIPRLHAPPGAAIVTSPNTNSWLLMKTLFWNRNVTRVLVLGQGSAADGFAGTDVHLVPGVGLVDRDGKPVVGPFEVDADTFAAPSGDRRTPALFLFGWSKEDGYLDPVSWLDAATGSRALEARLVLSSVHGTKEMAIRCGRMTRRVAVGVGATPVVVRVAARSEVSCRIGLIAGSTVEEHDRTVSVHAQVTFRRLPING